MKNHEILKIFEQIEKNDLFTHSLTHENAREHLRNDPDGDDGAQFIATLGMPDGVDECSKCRKMLPAGQFRYYQTRVKSDGTLMRANALCKSCGGADAAERAMIFAKEAHKIPPRPKSGDICPKCNRAWNGIWHRDHNRKTDEFEQWLCGQCNMAMHNGRTPDNRE
ncbi:MAG: hypothetical protein OD918_09720 [Gammaproteobacteria bacterium]